MAPVPQSLSEEGLTMIGPWRKRPAACHLEGPDTVAGNSLQQWIAARIGRMAETETEVKLGAQNFTRTWLVTGYPEGEARLGRLNHLLRFHTARDPGTRVHLRLTYHMIPSGLPDNLRTRWMRNRQAGMAGESAAQGTPDATTTKALHAYSDMWQAVQFQEDRVLELWIGITATAPDRQTLDRLEKHLLNDLAALNMAVTPLYQEQLEGLMFSQVLGQRQDRLMQAWSGRLSHTLPLSYLHPFLHGSISEGHGVYTGHEFDELGYQHAGHVDFTAGVGAMNWVISGLAGEGKTTLVKGLSTGLLIEGFRMTQYDANGEYRAYCDSVGGIHIDMTTAGGRYYDPFVIAPPTGDPDHDRARFSQTCSLFHCLLVALVPNLTDEERELADRLMMQTWQGAGVDRDRPETWHNRASIHTWYGLLVEHAGEPVAKGLRAKLSIYFEGSLQIFKQEDETDWTHAPYVRVAVDAVSSDAVEERVATAKTLLVTHRVWGSVVATKHAGLQYSMINVDEGQRVLRVKALANHFYQLATDGRKFNTGLSVCTNDLNVFHETDPGKGLWENATLRVLFYHHDSSLKRAAESAAIPETVLNQVRSLHGSHQYMMTRDLRRWTLARMELPTVELELARTRGLRQEGA